MGVSAINLPIDVVSNVRVVSNPYDSEYGKFAGAISTVMTKSSDLEKFHGSLQNFVHGQRERDGSLMGIGGFTPRLTLSTPVIKGRVSVVTSRLVDIGTFAPNLPGRGCLLLKETPGSRASTLSPAWILRSMIAIRLPLTFRFIPRS